MRTRFACQVVERNRCIYVLKMAGENGHNFLNKLYILMLQKNVGVGKGVKLKSCKLVSSAQNVPHGNK